jgi:hypothetical protein
VSGRPLSRGHGFRRLRRRYTRPIATEPNKPDLQALIQLEVACHVALGALPRLPEETEQALRKPVQELREVARTELQRIDPSYKSETPI